MLLAAVPQMDVRRVALFKRRQREALRILIAVLCLVCCRRGRRVVSCIIFKVWSTCASTTEAERNWVECGEARLSSHYVFLVYRHNKKLKIGRTAF